MTVQRARRLHDGEVFWDLRFRRNFRDWEVEEFQNLIDLLHRYSTLQHSHNMKRWLWGILGLVIPALDNRSGELKYTSRSKYMEELMASILFSWVATGVSIVNTIFSLASTAADPVLPSFSKEIIARTIMTVVDGFLEKVASSQNIGLIDKINIFPTRSSAWANKDLIVTEPLLKYQSKGRISDKNRSYFLGSLCYWAERILGPVIVTCSGVMTSPLLRHVIRHLQLPGENMCLKR
ncbi:hypothetical protein HAX54_036445 [Datura stramonium]|uniref:Uncharacterized protein n=1 Tax=Datura stramonium TaxID=4076 RepID=A0ABS8SGH1_DATST|nr:hypothetical protein [Datura stramonium]